MTFNSISFLIFLFVVVLLYWIIPHRFRYILLLIASYFFYMCWNWKLIILILSTTLLTYFAGLLIERANSIRIKRIYLIITLSFCLGLLIYFKYFSFLYNSVINLLNVFGASLENKVFDIILPVGISFYTFQTLSYVIDIYNGKYSCERSILYYALFVSFFPQLVAGPIERPCDLIPELKKEKKPIASNFIIGFKYILIGFVRKCCIADLCGIYVDSCFSNLGSANSLATIIAAFLFLIQIYNDFAGYSEIALGSAKLLGIDLSINFNFPLLSKSYTEFFRRWHITLNKWFTDYVYIPLGGNRKGKARKILNTLIVFLLCGLWHGANWTFVLWGLVAGVMISIETLLKKPVLALCVKIHLNINSNGISIFRNIVMIFLFCLRCILFRAQSLNEIGIAFSNIFTKLGFGSEYFISSFKSLGLDLNGCIYIVIAIVIMYLLKYLYNINFIEEVKNYNYCYLVLTIFIIFLIAFCWLYVSSITDSSIFQYFQF